MITPADIKKRAETHYKQWLAAIARGNPVFEPLVIQRTGDQKTADGRWDSLSDLVAHSKEKIGYGYQIQLEAPAPNSKNKQSRLRAIEFHSGTDLLEYIGKTAEIAQFQRDCALIAQLPELQSWPATHVREIVQFKAVWPRLLAVARFFRENPAPGLPVRLLPIEGIDTKFVEQFNGILCQLLDHILPPTAIEPTQKNFSKRYRLPEQSPLIECAWNDPALTSLYGGFQRLAFPSDQLEQIPLKSTRILVVENKNSLLQVIQHDFPDGIVVFGGGFGVSLLKNCQWMHDKQLYYWGDLDAHGLAILSQFRQFFPHTRPLFMNAATLDAYPEAIVTGKAYAGALPQNLTPEELQLFHRLNQGLYRLEQERIVFNWAASGVPTGN
jgi:hypothetical protein